MAKTNTLAAPTLLDHTSGLAPNGTCLVAGMSWKPLLGQNPGRLAAVEAKNAGGTHYAYADKSGSAGFAKFKASDKVQYLSMASLFAASIPASSTVFLALSINETQSWICAVSNGSVLAGYDLASSSHETSKASRDAFNRRFPEGEFWGDVDGLDLAPVYTWESLAEQLANVKHVKDALLRPVGANLSLSLNAIPRPIIWMVTFGLLAILVQKVVWPVAKSFVGSREEVVVEDPELLWQQAIDSTFNDAMLSAPGTLQGLLVNVNETPVLVSGWRLESLDCDWSARAWKCNAKYKASSRMQTNEAFESARPKDWKASWALPQGVTASFNLPAQSVGMSLKGLKKVSEHEIGTASRIQSIGPVLTAGSSPMSNFTQVEIKPPTFAKGEPVPLPPSIKLPLHSMVNVTAPLRTGAVVDDWANEVTWKKATFSFDIKKTPGANDSVAMMTLKGEIYATP